MQKVGITGGIGSGKTTVCKIFEQLGIPVYYADEKARQLMEQDDALRQSIVEEFGKSAYLPDQSLDRKFLSGIVFKDKEKLDKLNSLVHPAVAADFQNWTLKHKTVPYILKEAALLVESGSYRQLDRLIVVTAPEELRINRVMKRDKVSQQEVVARIQKQLPEKEKIQWADYVIVNDGEALLLPQVLSLHRLLFAMTNSIPNKAKEV